MATTERKRQRAQYKAGNGIAVVGGHSDSPNLRLKPVSRARAHGHDMLAVVPYGGGLWHSWFDRDLSVAGRVIVRRGDEFHGELVKIDRPILRLPLLCIHLQRNRKSFEPQLEKQMLPVMGLAAEGDNEGAARHSKRLLGAVARELDCEAEDIEELDLQRASRAPSAPIRADPLAYRSL